MYIFADEYETNNRKLMKNIVLILLSILMAATAFAQNGVTKTNKLPTPQRKMLEQGKEWAYVYHHFEEHETSDPEYYGYDQTTWMTYYVLDGDTVIDGRQYMKMFRSDERNSKKKYFGAFREDDEGRVYMYDYYGDGKDKKIIDFSLNFDDDPELMLLTSPDSILVENIKENGELFRRYRYGYKWADGNYHFEGDTAVEGVGFRRSGLAHYIFEPVPTCICDYESLAYVMGRDFWFDASAFDAPKEIELTEDERQLVASNNDFAFNLFRNARGEENSIMSPLSITYALGMMNNGAAGQTQQEINDVLGFGDAGADGINQFCRKMLDEASTLDSRTKAHIANTIYVNSSTGYKLQQGFVDKANTFYDAQPEARDFYDGVTRSVINQWANDHTSGMIPEVFPTEDSFNKDAASYLLNAIYFKGLWTHKFDKANTRDEAFNSGSDMVPMMSQVADLEYTESDLYQSVRLPYGNGAYLMTLFLPREGKTIADVLATMNGSNWRFKGSGEYHVDLKMPRFKTDTDLNLVPVMKALGMPTAFSEAAEFPYFGNRDVFISNMFQKAVIDLDEEGTEAAAVTVIEAEETSIPRWATFHANRPFFYIISEQSTGAIFFIGQYVGDTTVGIKEIPDFKSQISDSDDAVYDLQGRCIDSSKSVANGSRLKKGIYIVSGKKVVVK